MLASRVFFAFFLATPLFTDPIAFTHHGTLFAKLAVGRLTSQQDKRGRQYGHGAGETDKKIASFFHGVSTFHNGLYELYLNWLDKIKCFGLRSSCNKNRYSMASAAIRTYNGRANTLGRHGDRPLQVLERF